MRFALAGVLLATTFLAPAMAADFNTTSKIDKVTVYPQGADVTRLAEINLPAGDHRIILADLPASIDTRSIRVEGEGNGTLEIASVDTRNVYVSAEEQDQKRKLIEKQITALQDERNALDQVIGDANNQRNFLLGLADKQLVPQSSTDTLKGIDVAQLSSLLDLVQQRLSSLAKVIQDAQQGQRGIDEKMQELSAALAALAPSDSYKLEAAINVAAASEMKGTLRISYRLQEAGWLPYYDARMTTPEKGGDASLEVVRRAEVTQSSAESWDNVELVLSTARPTDSTAAPDLSEEELTAYEQKELDALRKMAVPESSAAMEAPAAGFMNDSAESGDMNIGGALIKQAAKPKLVAQRQAAFETAGFQANYIIPGRVTVDNTGTAKKVRITSATQQAKLEVVSVPLFDANAYLTAAFTVGGEGPLLPGYANLYRDGIYVGQGNLPLLNTGEEARLGFGIDDMVKVERKEVKKAVGSQGIISTSNVEERAWDISVKNLHDFKVAVKILDRKPFTARDDVEIATLPGMTAPTEENVDKKRGVMAWSFEVEPHKDTVIKTGYRITWPDGMKIGMAQ
ncbi:MAG: mucoidy inhibitor MuiA family protein [Proteobacteria bacterium]|nr:mucoidy inhibitor MuiA family protein [Pseudomonadota bacterium]